MISCWKASATSKKNLLSKTFTLFLIRLWLDLLTTRRNTVRYRQRIHQVPRLRLTRKRLKRNLRAFFATNRNPRAQKRKSPNCNNASTSLQCQATFHQWRPMYLKKMYTPNNPRQKISQRAEFQRWSLNPQKNQSHERNFFSTRQSDLTKKWKRISLPPKSSRNSKRQSALRLPKVRQNVQKVTLPSLAGVPRSFNLHPFLIKIPNLIPAKVSIARNPPKYPSPKNQMTYHLSEVDSPLPLRRKIRITSSLSQTRSREICATVCSRPLAQEESTKVLPTPTNPNQHLTLWWSKTISAART